MYESEHHEMHLETTYPSGAEQWSCPTCGRRFVVRWLPACSMTILDFGDLHAQHSGSTDDLHMRSSQVVGVDESLPMDELDQPPITTSHEAAEMGETPLTDELQPWLKWLKDAGLHNEGSEAA